jgi:hypothetical protein
MIHGEVKKAFKESTSDAFLLLLIAVLEIESELAQLRKDECSMKLSTYIMFREKMRELLQRVAGKVDECLGFFLTLY